MFSSIYTVKFRCAQMWGSWTSGSGPHVCKFHSVKVASGLGSGTSKLCQLCGRNLGAG